MDSKSINTFIVNLMIRTDRKKHSIEQFNDKSEFNFNIIEAIEHKRGANGLWETILGIIRKASDRQDDFIILCEDDHEFTAEYSYPLLLDAINEAQRKNADVLLGGVSWFDSALQIGKGMFWVDRFNGLQFTIIFKRFYNAILEADFSQHDSADFKISTLTDNAMVIYPFISVQKEFGYSDVTNKNGEEGHVSNLFKTRSDKLEQLVTVADFHSLIFE